MMYDNVDGLLTLLNERTCHSGQREQRREPESLVSAKFIESLPEFEHRHTNPAVITQEKWQRLTVWLKLYICLKNGQSVFSFSEVLLPFSCWVMESLPGYVIQFLLDSIKVTASFFVHMRMLFCQIMRWIIVTDKMCCRKPTLLSMHSGCRYTGLYELNTSFNLLNSCLASTGDFSIPYKLTRQTELIFHMTTNSRPIGLISRHSQAEFHHALSVQNIKFKTNINLGSIFPQGVSRCELTRCVMGNCCTRIWQFLHPSDSSIIAIRTRLPVICRNKHLEVLCLSHALSALLSPNRRDRSTMPMRFILTESNFLSSFLDNRGPRACSEPCTQFFSFFFPMRKSNKYQIAHAFASLLNTSSVSEASKHQVEHLKKKKETGSTPQERKSFNVQDFCIWTAV